MPGYPSLREKWGRGVTLRAPDCSQRGFQGGRQDTPLPDCPRKSGVWNGGNLPCLSLFASDASR